jgi:hypothetical protein
MTFYRARRPIVLRGRPSPVTLGGGAEMCLAHAAGSAVELAYQRSDYLAQRRVVMDPWATFLTALLSNQPPRTSRLTWSVA